MKNVTKIVILTMYAALSLSSCRKVHITPEETKTPLGFTAVSQTGMTKAETDEFPHDDFGVWGVARHDNIDQPYVLWLDGMEVATKGTDGSYVPTNEAYWLKDYTYNFLAVAPYTDGPSATTPSRPSMTSNDELQFTFDMGVQYTKLDYDFDLMGAAATSTVDANHDKGSQTLIFWHLLSKIVIVVLFVDDNDNPIEDGTVNAIRLSNMLTKADYTIGFDQEPASTNNTDYPLNVQYSTTNYLTTKLAHSNSIVLNVNNIAEEKIEDNKWTWNMHIIPQVTKDFDMYMDFTVGGVSTTNFKANLSALGDIIYQPNSQYIWKIRINPKTISFNVTVTPWQNATGPHDFDIK